MTQINFVCTCPLDRESIKLHTLNYISQSHALAHPVLTFSDNAQGQKFGLGFATKMVHTDIVECAEHINSIDLIANAFIERAIRIVQEHGRVFLSDMNAYIEPFGCVDHPYKITIIACLD